MKRWIIIIVIVGMLGWTGWEFFSSNSEPEVSESELGASESVEGLEGNPEIAEGLEKGEMAPNFELEKMDGRSEEHTSELQSRGHLVCRLLLEKKNKKNN